MSGSISLNRVVAAKLQEMMTHPRFETNDGLEMALRLLAKWRSQLISNTLKAQTEVVLDGPFAGMRFAETTEGSVSARLIGSYEKEIQPFIEKFAGDGFGRLIDIGCAEGYYAVGFALRNPRLQVYAFDISEVAQAACRRHAQLNHVSDRVHINGAFSPELVGESELGKTLIICDAEGAESDLMDPLKYPLLRSAAALIVECHENSRPGVIRKITEWFSSTHAITLVRHELPTARVPDWLQKLSQLDQLLAVWEWRHRPTPWLVMVRREPIGGNNPAG